MLFIMRGWIDRISEYAKIKRVKVSRADVERVDIPTAKVERVDTRRRYIQLRYTDTGEITTIDIDDPDTYDKMFDSGRPVEVMGFNRTID